MYRLMTSTPHWPSSRSSDASRCRQPSWKKTLTSWSSIVELHAGSTYFGELGSETKPDQFGFGLRVATVMIMKDMRRQA